MQGLAEGLTLSRRFQLVRRLGKGGMGEVWLSGDAESEMPVALKILAPDLRKDPGFIDLLQEEFRKARQLTHPNIVRVYDFFADDEHCFIAMQYIGGGDLTRLRGATFQEIVRAALAVCDALDYAHRQGFVHRDIKPSNVLLDERGSCILTDFGVAAALEREPKTLTIRGGGSLPSMSPQQLAGEAPNLSDDIYGFGALLYELLSGRPLFDPDVTPARIRDAVPVALSEDGTGQPIPEPLIRLVAAALEKSAARRPAGMGSIRAVLEEVQSDFPLVDSQADEKSAGAIRPIRRQASRTEASSEDQRELTDRSAALPRKAHGLSGKRVYAGLLLLLVAAASVIFYLPTIVERRAPSVPEKISERPPERESSQAQSSPGDEAQRDLVDKVLGELLPLDDRLRSLGIERWGGADWAEARRLADAGDEAYRNRTYDEALTRYRGSLGLMQRLEPRATGVLKEALTAGQEALARGDKASAVSNFELALDIDGSDAIARQGLERAMSLDRVIDLMTQASDLEAAGNSGAARQAYAQVLDIDPQWQPAREGLQRTGAALAIEGYQVKMAEGLSALAAEDFVRARAAFAAALINRPGDSAARDALAQLEQDETLKRIIEIQNQAAAFEAQERWGAAIERYEAALAIDANISVTNAGLARSRERQVLEQGLLKAIERSNRLNEDPVWQAADQLLAQARQVDSPGPALQKQITELGRLLKIASVPVPVVFESDNLTNVVIYKVGRLGAFLSRTLSLKPGSYVAVGSRDGFRDVRANFSVVADGVMSPIVLRCEEPI